MSASSESVDEAQHHEGPQRSALLDRPPYGPRDDARFLREMNALTQWHLCGCPAYARVVECPTPASCVEELPFLHVGLFKHLLLKTVAPGIVHERTLMSSATTGASVSHIPLDRFSSVLQAESCQAILRDFLGNERRPLIILDHADSLRRRGEVMAKTAAAMILQPMATDIHFICDAKDSTRMNWDQLLELLEAHDRLLVYGVTWTLWKAWGEAVWPDRILSALAGRHIHFVHSGGWKKLEEARVNGQQFEAVLRRHVASDSRVIDYYGLVEQVGVIYPLCEEGYRHVPVWADVVVRDSHSLQAVSGDVGQLQLLNVLAYGAPYHSVLTEDLGVVVSDDCPCGRLGKRFELRGRIPKAELRGCANG